MMWKLSSQRWALALLAVHSVCFVAAFAAAMVLRFDANIPPWMLASFWSALPWLLLIKLVSFGVAGQFRYWWGHVSFVDLAPLLIAATVSEGLLFVINELRLFPGFLPRGVLLLDLVATVALLVTLRSISRGVAECIIPAWERRKYRSALLVGASTTDKVFAMQLHRHRELPFRICGHIDRTSRHRGQSIGGARVLGALDDLAAVAASHKISDVLVIAGSLKGSELRRLRSECERTNLRLHMLPPLHQLVSGAAELPVRPLDVDSLLRRPAVELDERLVRKTISGKVVMVTGAGGSIGSELCRQILRFEPQTLILVDRSEPSLYEIHRELTTLGFDCQINACLGDVTDPGRLRQIFETHGPQLVFHAAAHKHVPLLEGQASEAVKNNLFGTALLADFANKFEVERFICISTDKAVKPSSIMGLSKHLAERYVLSLDAQSPTRFMAVRFGNVLGSAGSVVPLFYEQIRRGGPITITHPQMQRYFMTIKEASKLVLQAATFGEGGDIFVLDMGKPVKIVDLARDMIQQSGLPEHAIEISFVGVRPGEKLYEELYFDDEERLPTPHPKLFRAKHRVAVTEDLQARLDELQMLVDGDNDRLIAKLRDLVPEYDPVPELHHQDQPTPLDDVAQYVTSVDR